MKIKLTLTRGISLFASFILFIIFLFWNSKKNDLLYFNNDINGIIEYKVSSRNGELLKLNKYENLINLRINQKSLKYFKEGDSISKPPKSREIFLFKKDSSEIYETYFYIESISYLWN